MSAIFGLLALDGRTPAVDDLQRMDKALAAHGGDGGGTWVQNSVALGQRLMRFTPQDNYERQPLLSTDGQFALVIDGRIDNRMELAGELGVPKARLAEWADSQLVLAAHEAWGEGCVQRLTGDYAFAFWDRRAQTLLAACSPLLGRSFFFSQTQRMFAFASLPAGLLALPFVPRQLDEQYLADLLVRSKDVGTATCWRDIRCLPPGHLLTVNRRQGLRMRQHWQIDLQREIHFARDADCADAFASLFDRVVEDHLRSATPTGMFMSGGLDSSAVAATAARLLAARGERLAAYTEVPRAGFDGPVVAGRYADETPFAQAVASHCGHIDLTAVRSDDRGFLDDTEALFETGATLFPNTANRPWWEAILQQARAQGVRVLLTGEGGNLTVSWNGRGLLPQLLRQGRWVQAWREARALALRGHAKSSARALIGQGLVPLLPLPMWAAVQRARGLRPGSMAQRWLRQSPIHPDFAAAQRVEDRMTRQSAHGRPDADTRQARFDALTATRGSALDAGFRARFGVDSRHPLTDMRLVEFCLALPESQYLGDGVPRRLIRRAMAERLPPLVLDNRQRGLQAADWHEQLGRDRSLIAAEIDGLQRSDLARRMLDLARLRRLVEQWPQAAWNTPQVMADYRSTLGYGLMAGRYLRWLESKLNQATPAPCA